MSRKRVIGGLVLTAAVALGWVIKSHSDRRDDRGAQDALPAASSIFLPSMPPHVELPEADAAGYVGPEACAECHQQRYDEFVLTAHFQTSAEATPQTVHGPFEPGRNRLLTSNPHLWFEMTADEDGFHQVVHERTQQGERTHKQRFDLVTGSGKNAQTGLYWLYEALYQMPVSYFPETGRWINSPGYPDGAAHFRRAVPPGCLVCHATYFQSVPDSTNLYHQDSYILGVTCERCHSTGAEHVAYHRAHPNEPSGKHIVNPAALSPERVNDVCAQCHSRLGPRIKDWFSYRPGEPLEEYFQRDHHDPDLEAEVHSENQMARLKLSKCFQANPQMTCMDCHNPHQHERGEMALFSQRCLNCHETDHCGLSPRPGARLAENCIDCHMPKREDRGLEFVTPDAVLYPMLRDHHISIWPDATEHVLQEMGL